MKNMLKKRLFSGDEAIARGAIEAGISTAVSYPGTPATEILESIAENFDGDVQWAVNEKVAFETAMGVSYAGRRAICSMKHVGLNVAADPLMTAAYLGVKGGLVLAVADDPGAYSSQNEQDSRFYAGFAKIPCFEPSDVQEAKDMTVLAFELSEISRLPVMLRSVTRLSHTSSSLETGQIRPQNPVSVKRDPERMLAVPKFVVKNHEALNKKQKMLEEWGGKNGLNKITNPGCRKGIIACGTAFGYAAEYAGNDYSLLKISFYPFNENIISGFVKGLDEVWVLEEGEPIVENTARKFSAAVKGKISGEIKREGELGPDEVALKIFGKHFSPQSKPEKLPVRPPVLCPGCPHRELYKALKKAEPAFTAGDIGCYTLGANPPLSALDTCLCMGASISKAAGMANQGVKKVAAVLGDSTFLHSGITALISAVYNKSNILVFILDNSSTAMTGHQPTPLTGITAKGTEGGKVSLEEICRACGAASVEVTDPFDAAKTELLVKDKLNSAGVNVIISRKPCVLLAKRQKK